MLLKPMSVLRFGLPRRERTEKFKTGGGLSRGRVIAGGGSESEEKE